MNILILGATGFIGNALFLSLVEKHTITIASRKPIEGYNNWKKIDFSAPNNWDKLLDNIHLVINTIGIIEGDFEQIQTKMPIELFHVCIKNNIKIIHISAIGAEKTIASTPFLKSKKITDTFLLQYKQAKIIYPAIVIGKQGKSTQFFVELSQLPIIPIFSDKPISFIHINQLVELIQNVIIQFDSYPQQIFAVSKPEPLKNVLLALKGKNSTFIKIPKFIFSLLFAIFPKFSIGIFNKDTLTMFNDNLVEDYKPIFSEVSKSIDSRNFIPANTFVSLFALLAISFVWVLSGLSSLVSWTESTALMSEIGANHQLSIWFIWLGSIADIFLGIALFAKKYRKQVLVLQIAMMLIYMLILTIAAPHYWLHPFGVLTKNIPLISLSYYLYTKQK